MRCCATARAANSAFGSVWVMRGAFIVPRRREGRRIAQIDVASEMGMSNPTSGLLCVTGGPHMERCSPSFVWSDDSRYLAVPQYSPFLQHARLLIISFEEKSVFASKSECGTFSRNHFHPGGFSSRLPHTGQQRIPNRGWRSIRPEPLFGTVLTVLDSCADLCAIQPACRRVRQSGEKKRC